jgi:hypothetical protein
LKKIISKLKVKLETVRDFFDCFYFKIQINIVNLHSNSQANILLANTTVLTENQNGEASLTNQSLSISIKKNNNSSTDSDETNENKKTITLNYTDVERGSNVAQAMINSEGVIKNKLLSSKSTKLSSLIKTASIENNSIFYNKYLRKTNELSNDYRSSSSSPSLQRRTSIINKSNIEINTN